MRLYQLWRLLIHVAVCVLLSLQAQAKTFNTEELAELQKLVTAFEIAVDAKDTRVFVMTMPPKVRGLVLTRSKISEEQLIAEMDKMMKAAFEQVQLLSFSIDLHAGTMHELEDGTSYMLLPTETLMESDGKKMLANSQTLAFQDEGKWYLVRVAEVQQKVMLGEAYPQFKGVELPEVTLAEVQE